MKKGFTLIELLAVIVILAVIALIATPIIINIINDSQEQSIKSSANLYVDGLSKYIVSRNMLGEFNPSSCTITNGNISCDGTSLDYTVDGDKPTSGTISFNNGIVTGYTLCISDYKVTKTGNNVATEKDSSCGATNSFGGTKVAAVTNDTHKGIVYLDPTDLTAVCTAALATVNLNDEDPPFPTGISSGCMKFYIFDDSGDNYKMILDHNTSGNVAWNYNACNDEMIEVSAKLAEDTLGWVGNPRLITADEIAHIVGADTALEWDSSKDSADLANDNDLNSTVHIRGFYFDGSGDTYTTWWTTPANSSNKSSYAWLYNYTAYCESHGCEVEDDNSYPYAISDDTTSVEGYWTSSPVVDYACDVWVVDYSGFLNTSSSDNVYNIGVRPVITLPKSVLE